ncbi:MAG TPA: acetyl-CoA carboxylase [Thermodesulfobacteriota bacterium]|nr:acetyl-CoA carboxylase [Thermodesulfobacteriota bacterium]
MAPDQERITYSLTYKEILDILKIVDESPCQELRLEVEGLKLEIIKGKDSFQASGFPSLNPAPSPTPALPPPPDSTKPHEESAGKVAKAQPGPAVPVEEEKISGVEVKSPLSGIFYRAPAPGARPFVEIGSRVESGEQVGIVEVMKLMNSIKSPVKGTVRKILAENDKPVKMGQTLMIIEPG